ncbi:uncharacterized protein LOC131181388 [Hevea brasiliensis]|uniref:uncharacterized protein LOC131181388 n=1 Tax=Hevea brasiliensis TaxID=3981 RepID=UPI0025DEDB96|nr:uncharacterized protein LOC131181388 [Hevea brasiliensis]
MQRLAFQGNDESKNSLNQGNFLELLKVLASCNEEINNVILKNALDNLRLTSPDIQKDIINAVATETTKAIITDLGDDLFSILVDECRDISVKEQMRVAIRYVNGSGCVIERFIGLVYVHNTSAASLKKGIESLLSTYGLSIFSLRGQGCDGASNMRSEFNSLKSLILKNNSSAYYIYCFAHQLQLTLVAVAKKHSSIGSFFNTVTRLVHIIGGSYKCRDMLREKQLEKVFKGIAKVALIELESQLQNFVFDMCMDEKFSKVSGIEVATATVERAFSAMNIIKSSLRNRMGDELLNDCLVAYIERDLFAIKAEYCFEVTDTPLENRVKVAALYLKEKVVQWHQGYVRIKGAGLAWIGKVVCRGLEQNLDHISLMIHWLT